MSNLTVEIPKLLKLDKDDLKAIRSFLPGKLLGRTAALLPLLLLVLGFVAAVRNGGVWTPIFDESPIASQVSGPISKGSKFSREEVRCRSL